MEKTICPILQQNSVDKALAIINFVLDEIKKAEIKVINQEDMKVRPMGSIGNTSYAFLIQIEENGKRKGLSILINKDGSVQYGIIYWGRRGWEPQETSQSFLLEKEFRKKIPQIIADLRK